jgi:hypothetical protein
MCMCIYLLSSMILTRKSTSHIIANKSTPPYKMATIRVCVCVCVTRAVRAESVCVSEVPIQNVVHSCMCVLHGVVCVSVCVYVVCVCCMALCGVSGPRITTTR